MMVCTRKVWGVLGLLLALVVVVGYGQHGQQPQPPQPPQPLPIPEPSLDVYAYWFPGKKAYVVYVYVTLLLQGQPLTAVAESITVELQDRSAKTLATQQFAKISLAGTTQLIMAIPVPPPPEPWILKATAVVGGKIYSGETTVLTESGIAPSELMAAPPTPTPSSWVRVGPPFYRCGTGHNWASSGYQEVDCNAGRARIFENGIRGVTGEGWAWFASTTYSGRATQIRVQGNIRGRIVKPSGQPESSATLYAFIIGYNSNGSETGRIGWVVWKQDWDGPFNSTFDRTLSGTLPSDTTFFVKAYLEVRARVRDEWRPGGANGWVSVDPLSLTNVQIYF
jgi:hypothetical protein